jgi:hypothetical protein
LQASPLQVSKADQISRWFPFLELHGWEYQVGHVVTGPAICKGIKAGGGRLVYGNYWFVNFLQRVPCWGCLVK